MKETQSHSANESTAQRLERAASELPSEADDAAVSRIMYAVRTRAHAPETSRRLPLFRPAWLTAAATAVVAVVLLTISQTEGPSRPSMASDPLPVRMGQDIDPMLARTEHDLAQEMQSIRADLHHLSRMMTVRLESDSD